MPDRTSLVARSLMVVVILLLLGGLLAWLIVPLAAESMYGPASRALSPEQTWHYSLLVLWHDGRITTPLDLYGAEQAFTVEPGEPVASIAARLERAGLVRSGDAFLAYMIYSGLDRGVQSGAYRLSPALSAAEIAHILQDATPAQVTLVVLAGWRMEEVAAALPSSGVQVAPEDFLRAASSVPPGLDFLPGGSSAEGFLFPDAYVLPRTVDAESLVLAMLRNFALHLTPELREAFARRGLSVREAVTLASIIEREAVQDDEMPIIASVFFNRLAKGMKLESDPTVQYSLGYQAERGGWWPTGLTYADLANPSPYNTYAWPGLPPGPIASPGLTALRAVAYPAETPYYFFVARCDGSGRHTFSETYEQHVQSICR